MFLETLDLKIDDVVIYSKNQFNFYENFKIIFKHEKVKRPHPISYFEVCNYIKNSSPKNLIIYRLLTNVQNIRANTTKYGYFIKIEDEIELIYFDPIFAIKDLRHLQFNFDPHTFRFRIQQVGLTSVTKWEKEPNFAEVYCFDLKAAEAQNQNDKIFADAIFALDDNYIAEEFENKDLLEIPAVNTIFDGESKKNEILSIMEESQNSSYQNVMVNDFSKPTSPTPSELQILREEIISILRKKLMIQNDDEKINSREKTNLSISKNEPLTISNLTDLFKSTYKTEHLDKRRKENIILKFKND